MCFVEQLGFWCSGGLCVLGLGFGGDCWCVVVVGVECDVWCQLVEIFVWFRLQWY